MYEIYMDQPSAEFARCWEAAGMHIQDQAGGYLQSWLRADLRPPYREHLSFRLGNQLFFVQLEDVDGMLQTPGNRHGLLSLAQTAGGHACAMPMRRVGRSWRPAAPGWGLLDAESGRPLSPPGLISDEPVPMSAWELHDMAVQVVRQQLEAEGNDIVSWVSEADIQPALWVRTADGHPAWYAVSAVLQPADGPSDEATDAVHAAQAQITALPAVWPMLHRALMHSDELRGVHGHFAAVGLAACLPLAPGQSAEAPPLRGHPVDVRWTGHAVPVNVPGHAPGHALGDLLPSVMGAAPALQ